MSWASGPVAETPALRWKARRRGCAPGRRRGPDLLSRRLPPPRPLPHRARASADASVFGELSSFHPGRGSLSLRPAALTPLTTPENSGPAVRAAPAAGAHRRPRAGGRRTGRGGWRGAREEPGGRLASSPLAIPELCPASPVTGRSGGNAGASCTRLSTHVTAGAEVRALLASPLSPHAVPVRSPVWPLRPPPCPSSSPQAGF